MHVVIVGAGIAGTCAALALHKAGFKVSVHEAHPQTGDDIGAFLTLADNGMLALGQVGAAETVSVAGFALTRMRVTDEEETELLEVPLGGHEDPLTRYRCLRRAELCAALRSEVLRRGIPVVHGKQLISVTDEAGRVTARFRDGSSVTADLLIGADGLNSTARTLIAPTAGPKRYAGQRVHYGYSDRATPPNRPGRIEMVRGSTAAFGYAVSPRGRTYWFARVPGPELSAKETATTTTSARLRDELLAVLEPDTTPTAEIVAATDRILVTNAHDLPEGSPWRSGRTLLVGDAAHAASPATGQGASMALEDAVVLAKALRDTGSLDVALDTYERLRRPRVERNIANSARMTTADSPNRAQRARTNDGLRRRQTGGPDPHQGEEIARQLDWDTPLEL